MALLSDIIARGLLSARPAAGTAGRLYYATDGPNLYRDNGSSWDDLTLGGMTNPMTTQDDIIVAGASGTPARLAKGTDGQVLTVDPTTHHLVWATPSSGGSGALTVISDQTLAAAAATVTFASIAGTYSHLRLVGMARGDTAATTVSVTIQLNGDTAANYDWQYQQVQVTNGLLHGNTTGATAATLATIPAGSATAGGAATLILELPGYAGTTFRKTGMCFSYAPYLGAGNDTYQSRMDFGWHNTAAITSLTLAVSAGNFAAGTRLTLYGLS